MPVARMLAALDSGTSAGLTADASRRFPMSSGNESFLRTGLASLFFARMVDVVYTDVAGNASPSLL